MVILGFMSAPLGREARHIWQSEKYEQDELLTKLSTITEVQYIGYRGQNFAEKREGFLRDLDARYLTVVFSAVGQSLIFQVASYEHTPGDTKIEIRSRRLIFDSVGVRFVGFIDSQTLRGEGQLELRFSDASINEANEAMMAITTA